MCLLEPGLIRHGAPTLAGMKTGSLFCCPYTSYDAMVADLREANRRLLQKGVRFLGLRYRNGRALVYAYRPAQLCRDLKHPQSRKILTDCGYDPQNPNACLRRLIARLAASAEFPHEIGLFLGYPPEDVSGFICQGPDACKCVGVWKVYGDVDTARKTFRQYQKCQECLGRRWASGAALEQLTAAV